MYQKVCEEKACSYLKRAQMHVRVIARITIASSSKHFYPYFSPFFINIGMLSGNNNIHLTKNMTSRDIVKEMHGDVCVCDNKSFQPQKDGTDKRIG